MRTLKYLQYKDYRYVHCQICGGNMHNSVRISSSEHIAPEDMPETMLSTEAKECMFVFCCDCIRQLYEYSQKKRRKDGAIVEKEDLRMAMDRLYEYLNPSITNSD